MSAEGTDYNRAWRNRLPPGFGKEITEGPMFQMAGTFALIVAEGIGAAELVLVAGEVFVFRAGAAAKGGVGQTYQIIDGVRRSKATEIAAQQGLGNGRIAAQVVDGGRVTGTVEVEAASLLSPKSSISTAGSGLDRWFNTLRQTLGGSKPPAIQVQPGSTGTPIKNVLIE